MQSYKEVDASASGCESGWTMYLDQSLEKPTSLSVKEDRFPCKNGRFLVEEEEEEMDLSMVSDASSGPPHLQDAHDLYFDGDSYYCSATSVKKRDKRRKVPREEDDPSYFLDETASSHAFSFSEDCFNPSVNKESSMEDVLDFSIGFSTTHFNGKSTLQKHYGLLAASVPSKPTSKTKPVCKEESKRKVCR